MTSRSHPADEGYVELHACSAFSFLRGASFPEQLAERAAQLALPAVALLDRNGVYGAQRFSAACRERGVRAITGSDLTMEDGTLLPVLVENRTGYANLCSLLTEAHLRSEKGSCLVRYEELAEFSAGLVALFADARWLPAPGSARKGCSMSLGASGSMSRSSGISYGAKNAAIAGSSTWRSNFACLC
ncbi:MAG: PHP domain-containing protein [Chthoniobacterales bacterium]